MTLTLSYSTGQTETVPVVVTSTGYTLGDATQLFSYTDQTAADAHERSIELLVSAGVGSGIGKAGSVVYVWNVSE